MRLHPQARRVIGDVHEDKAQFEPHGPGFDPAALRAYLRDLFTPKELGQDITAMQIGGVDCHVWRPAEACETATPVLVYLHGGGWSMGSSAESVGNCRELGARCGWPVVAVDYALSPENPYPAALNQLDAVFVGLPEAGLGIDPERVVAVGDSAGANLAAGWSVRRRDAGLPGWVLQALVYPCLDLVGETSSRDEFGHGFGLDTTTIRWCIDSYTPDPADRHRPEVSPLRAESLSGLPPTLVATAGYDPLRDEGEAFAERLAEAGVVSVCVRYPNVIHGFANPGWFDSADVLFDQIAGMARRLA